MCTVYNPDAAILTARPIRGQITSSGEGALWSIVEMHGQPLEVARPVEGLSVDGSMKKDPEQKPSHTDVSRFRLASQRKEQRLRKMSSCRNLDQQESNQNQNPNMRPSQVVSRLISKFETEASPIKMPRPVPTSNAGCMKPNNVSLQENFPSSSIVSQKLKPAHRK